MTWQKFLNVTENNKNMITQKCINVAKKLLFVSISSILLNHGRISKKMNFSEKIVKYIQTIFTNKKHITIDLSFIVSMRKLLRASAKFEILVMTVNNV
jgi:hypothetical protein